MNRVQRNTDQQNVRVNVQPQKQSGHVGGRRQPIVGKGEVGAGLRATPLPGYIYIYICVVIHLRYPVSNNTASILVYHGHPVP